MMMLQVAVLIVVISATGYLKDKSALFRKTVFGLLGLIIILQILSDLSPAAAQQCPEFTRQPQADMLPIGTVVDITNYELVAPNTVSAVTRTGTVDEYFLTVNCPQSRPFNMDAQAYVIRYGAVDGSRRVVSQWELKVR